MTISDRLDRVERILAQHLEESGEMRNDIKWIKKTLWAFIGAMVTMSVTLSGVLAAHWLK
jgi:hypothetical protein